MENNKWQENTELHTLTRFLHFCWGAQIPGTMSPGRLSFILWHRMLSVLKMELASKFAAVFQNNVVAPRLLKKIVYLYPNIN